jgi:hypothetical protein
MWPFFATVQGSAFLRVGILKPPFNLFNLFLMTTLGLMTTIPEPNPSQPNTQTHRFKPAGYPVNWYPCYSLA